ncbi:hypothetical protein PHSC3_000231 [Chlamydiales bacterium STE3]|nr:hypothetical protein PHSC3_000231 [Chlamydiales bacterium STE3]
MRKLFFYLLMLLLSSCGPSSLEDYKDLGRRKTQKLLEELQKIQNRDQLLDAEKELLTHYEEIAELMQAVAKFHKQHPKDPLPPLTFQDHELSDKLRLEILRISRFDGGREIIDKICSKASNRN